MEKTYFKFGGWDYYNKEDGYDFPMFDTVDATTWAL